MVSCMMFTDSQQKLTYSLARRTTVGRRKLSLCVVFDHFFLLYYDAVLLLTVVATVICHFQSNVAYVQLTNNY